MCSIPRLLLPGANVTVFITRVNLNPICGLVKFWGNFVHDQQLEYQQMKKEIQYPRRALHVGEGKPGDLCLVHVYEAWCRARILSRNNRHYSVFLIDEGRTFQVHINLLAWGQTDFFNLAPEVDLCFLSDVSPLSAENGWSKLALGFMKSFCGRTVTARVLDYAIPQRAFLLDIPCLSRQMHEMGFARKVSNEEFTAYVSRSLQSIAGSVEPLVTASVGCESLEQIKTQVRYVYPELQAETTEVVQVTEVINPLRVFCQLKVFSQDLEKLAEHITQHYDRAVGSHFAPSENLGAPCASKGTDGKWYRSVLLQVTSTNDVAEVLHVDYGKKQCVQVDHVRALDPEFLRMPVVTYVCSLHGLIDQGGGWTVSQNDYLKSLLLNRTVIAKFEYQSLMEGVYYVTLHEDENTNINKLFGSREKCLIDSRCLEDYTEDESGPCQISVEGETQRTEAVDGSVESSAGFADMEAIDKMVRPHSKVVQTSDVFKTSAVSQSSSAPAVKASFKEYLFPVGSSFDVIVSYIESPNDFWCQKASDAKCLQLLMQDLQRYYANSEFQLPLEAACVARHPESRMWARALVIQKHQASDVTVLFVDYGETKKVPTCDLRRIDPVFLKMNGQAFRCCLYNLSCPVSHSTLIWSPDATLQFRELVDKAASVGAVLKCTVFAVMWNIQNVVFNVVDLESPFQSICRFLVQRGLAGDAPKMALLPLRLDTYYYSSHGIKLGTEEDLCITCVKNVNHFFCHLQRNSVQIDELADNVNSLCRQLQSINCPDTYGNFCFAKFTDGLWYRGQFKSKKPSFVVHFVDYGNTQEVGKSDLLPIPVEAAEVMAIPVQAVECGLSDMPEKVPSEVNNWFISFVTDHCFKASIVAKEPSGKLIVELYDGKTPVNAIIREKFLSEVERNEGLDVKDQYRSYTMSERQEIPQQTPEKHTRSQKSADSDESSRKCLDGVLKRDITPSMVSGITVTGAPKNPDTDFNLCSYKNPNISTGEIFAVYPSVIIGPQLFWCQYAETEKLQEISDITQKSGRNLESGALTVETLPIGSGCIAVFDEDQLWYRAQVTSREKDTLSVLFVDYGNESKVKISDIRPLPFEVSDLPPQALACQLDGFNELEGSWHDKAADQFFELINDQLLKVTVLKLADSSDMASPHSVKLEREELLINDEMKKYWTPISKRTSFETVEQAASTTVSERFSQDDHDLTSPGIEESENYGQRVGLKDTDDRDIIKSDFGKIRRAAESSAVGSTCVIWSRVHKGWCRAQTLKVSDDSIWVLLLDHDFVVMVDPVNIFEIVQEEPLKAEKEVEHEAVTCFAPQDPSDGGKMDEERSAGMELVISEEQTEDKGRIEDTSDDDVIFVKEWQDDDVIFVKEWQEASEPSMEENLQHDD